MRVNPTRETPLAFDHGNPATILPAIDSTAKGELVARRRFQRGSVYQNQAKTVWLGMYSEYILDPNGVERRKRKSVILGPIRKANGEEMRKREARRLLQPYLDRVNSSISAPAREHKSATFEAFVAIWERDYLSLSKPSTQATMRGQAKRLKAFFGSKELRQIGAADVQRLVARMEAEGYEPKTTRNLWTTLRLILDAALAQGYVDRVVPKPKLPRACKKKPRYFRLTDVAKIIAASEAESRAFYWLAAETGLRAGELAALTLAGVNPASVTVSQAVWNGKVDAPKTQNALRTLAVSPRLSELLAEQVERQKAKRHQFLFSASTGRPWDMNLFRKRKMQPLLSSLEIPQAGFHAFRHFNASLLDSLRVPLKTIQERLGHALSGSLTLDVYTHSEWPENVEAAQRAGEAIEKAENSVGLTAIQRKGPLSGVQEALAA
jgi:integrase